MLGEMTGEMVMRVIFVGVVFVPGEFFFLSVSTMKYLLKFHSDCFEILSADFLISYGYERHYDPSIFRPIFM